MQISTFTRSTKKGFTLIELLTVIAIIGILAAILIPVVSSVRESARASKCLSNLRQIGLSLALYTDDHDGRFPFRIGGTGAVQWSRQLEDYGLPTRSQNPTLDHEVFVCPSAEYPVPNHEINRSYTTTGAMQGGNNREGGGGTISERADVYGIYEPTQSYLVAEAHNNTDSDSNSRSNQRWNDISRDLRAPSPARTTRIAFWHNDQTNLLRADMGSVRTMSFTEFQNDLELWQWQGTRPPLQ